MLLDGIKGCVRVMACGLLVFWLAHFAGAEPWSQSSQRWLGEPGTPKVTERRAAGVQQAAGRLALALRNPGLAVFAVETGNGDFARLSLPGAGVYQMIGQPELPVYRKLLFFDRNARLTCNASVTSTREFILRQYGLPSRLFPWLRPIPKVPGAFESAAMELRQAVSVNATDVPLPVARLTEVGIMRDRKLVLLEVFPVAYDAKAGSVILREFIEVEIAAENSPLTAEGRPLENALPPHHALSPDGGEGGASPRGGEWLAGMRLLIVTPNQFVPLLTNFVAHKQIRGWTVELLDTTATDGSASAIRSEIQARYTNAFLRPTHLLLLGDTDTIPAWNGKGSYLPATDLYYACMDGTNDWLPDMDYGRFPARTAQQLTNMIAKTIAYENSTGSQTLFVRNAAFIASEENYLITEGTHNLVVTQHLTPRGYVSQKLYRHTYGATTAMVTNSINAGCSLVAYSGHGSAQEWCDPLVSNAIVLALTNEQRLPLVMSFACDTGSYCDYDESFAEAWLRRDAPYGAVAVLASSQETYWDEDDVFEKSVFAAIFEDQEPTAGGIIMRARERYLAYYGPKPETLQYFEQYNLFGDPTLRLMVLEAAPVLSGPVVLPDGSFQFTVNGTTRRTYTVQISSNLLDWTSLASLVNTNSIMYFRDPTAASSAWRYYRVVVP